MRKISFIILISILLLAVGCSKNEPIGDKEISMLTTSTSIGAVGENTDDFENQSFKYNITLTNNGNDDINIISITPILSAGFASLVSDENVTLDVNRTILKEGNVDISGEIIFKAKGLSKEAIVDLQPFIEKVKITEERIIK